VTDSSEEAHTNIMDMPVIDSSQERGTVIESWTMAHPCGYRATSSSHGYNPSGNITFTFAPIPSAHKLNANCIELPFNEPKGEASTLCASSAGTCQTADHGISRSRQHLLDILVHRGISRSRTSWTRFAAQFQLIVVRRTGWRGG